MDQVGCGLEVGAMMEWKGAMNLCLAGGGVSGRGGYLLLDNIMMEDYVVQCWLLT
jgi:hypothetical protein